MTEHDDEAAPQVRRSRRPAPLLAAAAAAVAAALTVGGVAAWRGTQTETPPAASGSRTSTPTPSPSAVPVPSGWKPVASLGMEIHVPAGWEVAGLVNDSCALKDAATRIVSRPLGAATLQMCGPPRLGTLVTFAPELPDGEPGRKVLEDGRTQITWAGPRGGAIVASGLDGAVLQQVIDTARAVDVDSLGCPTVPVRPAWDRHREGLPPVRLGQGVTDVVACVYSGMGNAGRYRMMASGRLDADQRSALARALSRAPAGVTPAMSKRCATDGQQEEAYAVLRVRTPAGLAELAFHWNGCGNRYVAGPDGQSAATIALIMAVNDALGLSYAYSPPMARG